MKQAVGIRQIGDAQRVDVAFRDASGSIQQVPVLAWGLAQDDLGHEGVIGLIARPGEAVLVSVQELGADFVEYRTR